MDLPQRKKNPLTLKAYREEVYINLRFVYLFSFACLTKLTKIIVLVEVHQKKAVD